MSTTISTLIASVLLLGHAAPPIVGGGSQVDAQGEGVKQRQTAGKSTETPRMQAGLWAACWSPPPADCPNLTPMIVLRGRFLPGVESLPTLSPVDAAAVSKAVPQGRSAVRWDRYSLSLFHHDLVRVEREGSQATVELWQRETVEAVKNDWVAWLSEFERHGGRMDYLIGDCESWNVYRSWSLSQSQVESLYADPRARETYGTAPRLGEMVAQSEVASVKNYLGSRSYLAWNQAVGRITAEAMNESIWRPAIARFEGLRGSNFGGMRMQETPAPDLNGHAQPADNVVGTASAIAGYGRIEGVATAWFIDPMDPTRLAKTGIKRLGKSSWTSFLLDVQLARSCRRTDPNRALQPWIALPSWKGIGRSMVGYPLDPRYYDEMIHHLALHGAETLLLWNPPASEALGISEKQRVNGAKRINGLIETINRRVGGVVTETTTLDPIAFDSEIVISGAKSNQGGTIWRVTLAPGVAAVRDRSTGRVHSPVGGQRGFWIEKGPNDPAPDLRGIRATTNVTRAKEG